MSISSNHPFSGSNHFDAQPWCSKPLKRDQTAPTGPSQLRRALRHDETRGGLACNGKLGKLHHSCDYMWLLYSIVRRKRWTNKFGVYSNSQTKISSVSTCLWSSMPARYALNCDGHKKNRKKGNSYMLAKGGSSLLDFQTQIWPCVDETFWCLFDLRFWGPQKKHGVSCPSCLWRFMFEQCRSICISTCPPCSGLQLATNTINFNARSPSCGTSCESHCYCPSDVAEEFHVHTYPNV